MYNSKNGMCGILVATLVHVNGQIYINMVTKEWLLPQKKSRQLVSKYANQT